MFTGKSGEELKQKFGRPFEEPGIVSLGCDSRSQHLDADVIQRKKHPVKWRRILLRNGSTGLLRYRRKAVFYSLPASPESALWTPLSSPVVAPGRGRSQKSDTLIYRQINHLAEVSTHTVQPSLYPRGQSEVLEL